MNALLTIIAAWLVYWPVWYVMARLGQIEFTRAR